MLRWLFSAALAGEPAPATVDAVDLDRYLGGWYEITSFPAWFQKGCTGTTAEYSLREDGKIRVVNTCFDETLEGPKRVAEGRAKVVQDSNGSKLKVSFFGPFWGDYWILGLADDYGWAVVGSPDRDYLWILARTPDLAPDVYASAIRIATEQGFDVSQLRVTAQPADAKPFALSVTSG